MTNTNSLLCPICGEGHLQAHETTQEVEYKGKAGALMMHFSVCDACGSEQAGSAEARANKREMMSFRKRVDGLLSGAEIRAMRDRLGISQAEAAHMFGGGPVAFSKYENDDVAQADSMDKLLRVADAVPAAFEWLARTAGETEIANRALARQFEQFRELVEKFIAPKYESYNVERSTPQAATLQWVPANDHHYQSLEVMGG